MSTATIVGMMPRAALHVSARPTSVLVAFTTADPAGVGATGGDQWFIRKSVPVVPPRLGRQLAAHWAGSVIWLAAGQS